TYVLAGSVAHGDSLGNRGSLGAGDVQWMTAGSGILHQEMPQGDPQGRMHGFQLWANLPASLKMTRPRYQDVLAHDFRNIVRQDVLIARTRHLQRRRQVRPQLKAVHAALRIALRHFLMKDAAAGGHPLHVARAEAAAIAEAVAMLHGTREDVRDRFD